jgi:dienelactone hydrolase
MPLHRNEMTKFQVLRAISATALGVTLCAGATAQLFGSFGLGANVFETKGLDSDKIASQSCTGFYKTPSFKCEAIKVPVYFARAKDNNRQAIVVVAPGAGGLDKRHSDYAKFLADNGINAVVMDPWRARGMTANSGGLFDSRTKGGDAINYAIDALAIIAQLRQQPEWKDAKFGFLGESMGGNGAFNVARPFVQTMTMEMAGLPQSAKTDFAASVALYPACTDRVEIERFKPVPMLLVSGGDDTHATAAQCERHTEWMNKRGAVVTFKVLPGEVHDWDAPYAERQEKAENASKCENVLADGKFTLLDTKQEFLGTNDGFVAMKKVCITYGFKAGNHGDPKTGYDLWLQFLKDKLLGTASPQPGK